MMNPNTQILFLSFALGCPLFAYANPAEMGAELMHRQKEISVDQVTPETNSDTRISQKAFGTDKQVLSPVEEEGIDVEPFQDEKVLFSDLKFPETLVTKEEIKISSHESVLFLADSIIGKLNDTTIVLDLRDQNLTSLSFAGYLLGPMTPANDYLDIYFQTLDCLDHLMANAKASADFSDQESFTQAQAVLIDFRERTLRMKELGKEEFLKTNLEEVVREHYFGEMPEYEQIKIVESQKTGARKIRAQTLEMIFEKDPQTGKNAERIFYFEKEKLNNRITRIQDQNTQGKVVNDEKFIYDGPASLKEHQIRTYDADGKKKTEDTIYFQEGTKNRRLYGEFDPAGKRLRQVNESFYEDGSIRTSSDYHDTTGKRYLYRYDSNGRMVSRNVA